MSTTKISRLTGPGDNADTYIITTDQGRLVLVIGTDYVKISHGKAKNIEISIAEAQGLLKALQDHL